MIFGINTTRDISKLSQIYVNDLLCVPKKCDAMGYVDETKLLLTLPPTDISVAICDLNTDLKEKQT